MGISDRIKKKSIVSSNSDQVKLFSEMSSICGQIFILIGLAMLELLPFFEVFLLFLILLLSKISSDTSWPIEPNVVWMFLGVSCIELLSTDFSSVEKHGWFFFFFFFFFIVFSQYLENYDRMKLSVAEMILMIWPTKVCGGKSFWMTL